ncbi:MAG: lytic murein transglycosylase [Candidatus Paceibacterota bacterium]
MPSFRKFWLPVILLALFLSHLPFLGNTEKETQNTETATIINWPDFSHEDIVKFAKNASKKTGVRPEFLIAILSQESSLGKNVGSCFLFDPKLFGGGVGVDFRSGIFSSRIMKPERDVEPFLKIMRELNRSPFLTPVSCPMKIGWGGAMGPHQILPSTWVLVKDRAAAALGKNHVDPWNPEDSTMAAAIHLKDLGADYKTVSKERTAACKYFSGKPCGEKRLVLVKKTKRSKPRHKWIYVENRLIASYGNSIVKKTAYFHKILNPPVLVAKGDTKAKEKSASVPKKQEIAKNFPKQKTKKKQV